MHLETSIQSSKSPCMSPIVLLLTFSALQAAALPNIMHGVSISTAMKQSVAPRVALIVQGRAKNFKLWRNLLLNMTSLSAVDLYYGSFDGIIAESRPLQPSSGNQTTRRRLGVEFAVADGADPGADNVSTAFCVYIPGSTWTVGRNKLARIVYEQQERKGYVYKYWAFFDDDSVGIHCTMCQGDPHENSCCMDALVAYMLLERVKHGSISLPTHIHPEHYMDSKLMYVGAAYHQIFHDCVDARIQAFHVDAVPIYVPYFEQLDNVSWWESQAMQFYFAVGCLSGTTIALGGFRQDNNHHARYPHGRVGPAEELALLKAQVPRIYDLLRPIKMELHKGFEQGDCGDLRIWGWQDPNYVIHHHPDNGWWRQSVRYNMCLESMRPRFLQYMQRPEEMLVAVQPLPQQYRKQL